MVRRRPQTSLRSLRILGCAAVSNHEATMPPHPSRRGEDAAPQDEGLSSVIHALIPPPEQHESAYLLAENAVEGGVVFGI